LYVIGWRLWPEVAIEREEKLAVEAWENIFGYVSQQGGNFDALSGQLMIFSSYYGMILC
jgi:hypothetical protein